MINGRRINLYDFSGTGIDSSNDADPDNYEINTGTLGLSGVIPGDPVRIRGLVKEFGQAPEDFVANTIINAANVRAHMVITYGVAGAATAIDNLDDSGVLFNLADATGRHHLIRAGIITDLNDLTDMPLVVPGDNLGIFAITQHYVTHVYTQYEDFLTALTARLEAGELVSRFDAHGYYDSTNGLFTSKRFRVKLADVE
jgi:hypothetical protein